MDRGVASQVGALRLTGTAQRESITITNQVVLTVQDIAARKPYLYLDKWGNGELRLRGLGISGE